LGEPAGSKIATRRRGREGGFSILAIRRVISTVRTNLPNAVGVPKQKWSAFTFATAAKQDTCGTRAKQKQLVPISVIVKASILL
jgi:hypothetical protein